MIWQWMLPCVIYVYHDNKPVAIAYTTSLWRAKRVRYRLEQHYGVANVYIIEAWHWPAHLNTFGLGDVDAPTP